MKSEFDARLCVPSINRLTAGVAAAVGSMLTVPLVAVAQDEGEIEVTGDFFEEIVVTSTRRTTDAQDVPYNIAAFSGDTLERQRITRLGETVAAIKQFCAGEPMEISGEHVNWRDFSGAPQSVQRPHPPIMIGGGSPRVLRLAGREANIASLNFNNRAGIIGPDGIQSATAEETLKKIGWVKEGAGDRFAEIELEIGAYFTFVTDNAEPIVAGMAGSFGLEPDQMRSHPHGLFGSPDEICDELERRREQFGISYITVTDEAMEAFAPVVAKLSGR